jgi:predicted DNA-binding transcriptional regulator YafY
MSMQRTERLLGILLHLQARGRATATELAGHFEVSRRTVLRDMEALSEQGVPLEAESGPGGGFRLMRGYFLPPLVFQPEEAWTLVAGLQNLLAHGGVPHRASLVKVADKVAAILDVRTRQSVERMARRIGLHVVDADPGPWLDTIAQAVLDSTSVSIRYDSKEGEVDREVDPYLLYSQGGIWYLQAYCHLRQSLRIFRTDRIRSLRLSVRRFTPPPDVSVLNPYAYRTPPESKQPNLRVRCTADAHRILSSHPEWAGWLQPDGTLVRWVPPAQFPFVARFLLGCGPGIVVEEPAALRHLVVELAETAISAHQEQSVT